MYKTIPIAHRHIDTSSVANLENLSGMSIDKCEYLYPSTYRKIDHRTHF